MKFTHVSTCSRLRHKGDPRCEHCLDVAARFTLQPPARLHTIEIAIDIELKENGRMVRRPARGSRFNTFEAQFT